MTVEQKVVAYLHAMADAAHCSAELHICLSASALRGAAERVAAGDHEVYARRIAARDRVVQVKVAPEAPVEAPVETPPEQGEASEVVSE